MKRKVGSGMILILFLTCTSSFNVGESIIGSEPVVLQTFAVDQLDFINATILDVSTSHNMTYSGVNINVYVEVEASWSVIDFASFIVAAYYNSSLIDYTEIIIFWSGSLKETFNFVWNTSTVEIGSYLIRARAHWDLYIDGYVHILPKPWDISGPTRWIPDGKCDIRDIALVALYFGSIAGDGIYDVRADITGPTYLEKDGKIDIRDIALVAIHFGEY